MKDITEIAFISYIEDLKTYDNKEYKIMYENYDWKLSIIAYEIMINELTDYEYLNQPEEDYLAFNKENNDEVIKIALKFSSKFNLYIMNKKEYDHYTKRKGKIRLFKPVYYCLEIK